MQIWATSMFVGYISTTQPRCQSRRLPARMAKLDHDLLALGMGKVNDFLQCRHLRVLPEADVFRRDSTFWCDRGRLDTCQTWATSKYAAKMLLVPECHMPIVGAILAHWRNYDTILQSQTAKFQWLEQLGNRLSIWLWIVCGASRWQLSRCEVCDLSASV